MTKQQLIDLLNEDLKNEYKHMHFYLHSAFVVQGLHREEIREYLLTHAKGEMQHVQEFADVIIGLGGQPTTEVGNFPSIVCPQEILEYALAMEDEVVDNYVERRLQAAELGGADGTYVELFLEDQILDSRGDADHLRKLVAKKRN